MDTNKDSMISHIHNCIFIHIPKCAGESIETALMGRPNWEKDDPNYKFLEEPKDSPIGRDKHYTIGQWKSNYYYDRYFKFSIVRNPWAASFSFYKYRKKRDNFPHSFNEWVAHVNHKVFSKFLSPLNYLQADNRIPLDYIGRFENLKHEWTIIRDQLKIKAKNLPHINKTPSESNYRNYYNKKSIDIVYKNMKKDIDYFKYEY